MKNVVIYDKAASGEVVRFDFEPEAETIWAEVGQMADLFEVDRTVIARHIRNIYACGELDESGTCAKNAQVQEEGGRMVRRQVKKYNLDVIISVGYRVNSAKATKFRVWANKVLKEYIVRGAAVNERRLLELPTERVSELAGTLAVVRRLMEKSELSAAEANGVLEVVARYAGISSDAGLAERKGVLSLASGGAGRVRVLAVDEILAAVEDFCGGECAVVDEELMGRMTEEFNRKGDVRERAANILYMVANGKPFAEENERIAAFLFVMLLSMNGVGLVDGGETKISDRALSALTLLMSESEAEEGELLIKLVRRLLK